jgi:hypothetical protein
MRRDVPRDCASAVATRRGHRRFGARAADEARFQKRDAVLPLFERHVLSGKLTSVIIRRPLRVVD